MDGSGPLSHCTGVTMNTMLDENGVLVVVCDCGCGAIRGLASEVVAAVVVVAPRKEPVDFRFRRAEQAGIDWRR